MLKRNINKYIEHTGKIESTADPEYNKEFRAFDLLLIFPENYRSVEKPWNENLDEFLEEIWNHKENENKIAVIYKIKEVNYEKNKIICNYSSI